MSASRSIDRRDLVRTLAALIATVALTACGKKGELELPPEDDDEEAQ